MTHNPRLRKPWKPDDSPPEQPPHTMGPECVYGSTLDDVPMTCPGCRWIVDKDKNNDDIVYVLRITVEDEDNIIYDNEVESSDNTDLLLAHAEELAARYEDMRESWEPE